MGWHELLGKIKIEISTLQVTAPGLTKDMVKMKIDKDGYLNVSIEHKAEKKDDVKH